MRAHDGDMFETASLAGESLLDDEYEAMPEYECDMCKSPVFYHQMLCSECQFPDNEYTPTKGERRAGRSYKAQTGPIRHLPGDYRPPKLRVRVR